MKKVHILALLMMGLFTVGINTAFADHKLTVVVIDTENHQPVDDATVIFQENEFVSDVEVTDHSGQALGWLGVNRVTIAKEGYFISSSEIDLGQMTLLVELSPAPPRIEGFRLVPPR